MSQSRCILSLILLPILSGFSSYSIALAANAEALSSAAGAKQSALNEQRYHYELAKGALKKKQFDKFDTHYALLGDYPLTPYLDYAKIKQNLYQFEFDKIERFFETNKDTFLEYRLREQLLHALEKSGKWADYLTYYHTGMRQKSLRCKALFARIAEGDSTAYDEVPEIWVEGKSQPKSCDPLFKKWRRHGGLTDEIAWQRFNNAMKKGKRSLASYIAGLMGDQYKAYAKEFLGVHAYPGRIKQHRRFAEQSLQTQQIISHGIKRLARIDPKNALYHWELYEAQQLFPKEISTNTKLSLVKRLTYKGFTEEAEALIEHSKDLRQKDVIERMIRESLRQEQYAKVLEWISYLDPKGQGSDRWRYWKARSQDELGITNAEESSTEIYKSLSKTRGFYGFLSADILKNAYVLQDNPSIVTPSTSIVVESLPAMKRAKELWLKGDFEEARAEWQFVTKSMLPNELAAAGQIARKWGWYNKGIHAMIRGKNWDDLDIRFPLAYEETVEKIASKTSIENTLIYAIARQESAFAETARSSAGAMGLMQLMPATARQTAQQNGIKHRDSLLFDPEYNINLGSTYLNQLLNQFNGNRILAAAAYNAGPHRVNTWIKKTPLEVPFDIWIESIPFKETRGYVQNVLAFSVIYAYRLGKDSEFITSTETGHWGHAK